MGIGIVAFGENPPTPFLLKGEH